MAALILPSRRVVQPNQAVDFSSSFPKPNAAFLGSIKRRDIATGTTYSLVTGEDTTTATISGVASRLFRGTALCTPASASGLDAALIMFRLPTAAITSRLFFGGDDSANLGAGFDVSAGVLRFLATQSSTAYVNATTSLSDGQIYCAFGYTTGILPSQRFIFVDGINVSGAAANNSRADKGIIRSNFGPSSGSPLPADILMAAVWKGARFNDEQARALSTNPWQLFKPVERRIWVPVSAGGGQTISPPVLTRTKTLHGPSISPGSVDLAPSLVTRSKVLYEPSMSQGGAEQIIVPGLLTRTKTVPSPVVVPGEVDLTPSLLTRTKTIHEPSVSTGTVLAPALVTRSNTLYSPTVGVGGVTLSPSLLTRGKVIYFPTLTGGDVPVATGGLFWPTVRRRRR